MADCYWLSELQFERMAPHLPQDARGVARVDDRRVISGIIHVLRVATGKTHRRATAPVRPCITASRVGLRKGCWKSCSIILRKRAGRRLR